MVTQNSLFKSLTYNTEIEEEIVASGGTIIFMKDNIIVASEISEVQYRELLNNSYISKLDVLPLKRYKNEGVQSETILQKIVESDSDGKIN